VSIYPIIKTDIKSFAKNLKTGYNGDVGNQNKTTQKDFARDLIFGNEINACSGRHNVPGFFGGRERLWNQNHYRSFFCSRSWQRSRYPWKRQSETI